MTAKSIYSKLNGLRPQAKPAQRARPVASVLALLAEAGIHLLLGAVLAGVSGLMTSYYAGGSAGAAITLYLAVWFALTFLARKK